MCPFPLWTLGGHRGTLLPVRSRGHRLHHRLLAVHPGDPTQQGPASQDNVGDLGDFEPHHDRRDDQDELAQPPDRRDHHRRLRGGSSRDQVRQAGVQLARAVLSCSRGPGDLPRAEVRQPDLGHRDELRGERHWGHPDVRGRLASPRKGKQVGVDALLGVLHHNGGGSACLVLGDLDHHSTAAHVPRHRERDDGAPLHQAPSVLNLISRTRRTHRLRVRSAFMLSLKIAAEALGRVLYKKQPKVFNPSWIRRNAPSVYRFTKKYLRTVTGYIDWDTLTRMLDRDFQRRWNILKTKHHHKDNQKEVDVLTRRFQEKLYTFVTATTDEDKTIRDTISIALVRMAQEGNKFATKELQSRIQDTIESWIAEDRRLMRWRGYEELIPEQVEACIRRYRYSGSFIGYLYRTLECVGRGLRPLEAYSLNEELPSGKKTKIENVIQDSETGEITLFR